MGVKRILITVIAMVLALSSAAMVYAGTGEPKENTALELYQQNHQKRLELLKTYADKFEPLTCHCVDLDSNGSPASDTLYAGRKHWTWSDGPIPWDAAANNCCTLMFPKGGV